MDDRYFARVAAIKGDLQLVINKGSEHGVKLGDRFLIIGLGDDVLDPNTNESLGKLEIVRGSGKVTHIQEKISTLDSDNFRRTEGTKEIRNVTSIGGLSMFIGGGSGTTVTESIKPGPEVQIEFRAVEVGDFVIRK